MDWNGVHEFILQSGLGAETALFSGITLIVLCFLFFPGQSFGLAIWISLFSLGAAFYLTEFCPVSGEFQSLHFEYFTPFLKRFFLISSAVGLFGYLEWRSGRNEERRTEIFILLLLSLIGLMLMISAQSLWLMFLSAEVFSFCSYALAKPREKDEESVFSVVRYFGTGAFASALAVFGLSWLLGFEWNGLETSSFEGIPFDIIRSAGYLLFIGFLLFKSGSFPFHFWVPALYEKGPTPWIGYISAAPKVAAAFGIIHVSKMLSVSVSLPLFIICCFGLLWGSLAAFKSEKLKNLIGYSSIAQAAFLLVPSVFCQNMANTENQLLIYAVSYSVVIQGAFCAVQFFENHLQDNLKIHDLAGHFTVQPLAAIFLLVLILSIIGLPPTIGFSSKLLLFSTLLPMGGSWNGLISNGLFALIIASAVLSLGYFYRIPYQLIFKPKILEDIPLRPSSYSFFWLIAAGIFSLLAFFIPKIFFPFFG
jgi:NADH-quinone oxidoreductase subunit N